jgi:hypothetical protein
MNVDDLLFYDVEVFSQDSFVVFKNIEKKLIRVFKNNFAMLADFVRGRTLVGYNNYSYDDKILTYMYEGKSQYLIKQLNDKIIGGESVKYINKPIFKSLDCYQEIDVSRPSLKKIEGNMGRMILESSVPFTIQRGLTEEEYQNTLMYCMYDVDMTINVFKERYSSYFQPKFSLLDMLDKPNASKWNTTTISANLLLDKPLPKWDSVRIPNDMWSMVPLQVVDMWSKESSVVNQVRYRNEKKVKQTKIEEFGCNIVFAYGGLHGEHKTIKRAKNVKLLDVVSMYPNIILLLNVLGHASEKYKEILKRRISIKHIDKILSDALKLILNSVYGNLKNQYSTLNNPMAALSVCIYGQISLYQLCRYISPFVEIININTDGVAFIPNDNGYVMAFKQWEKDFGLQLEEKEFDIFIAKDVNNYITKKGDVIKTKGGDVSRYHADAIFKNNNTRILDIGLVEYLLHGQAFADTFLKHLDQPHLFQYILSNTNKFQGTFDNKGNQYNKVNRVFSSKKPGFCLYKRRFDGADVKFPDAPQNMFLHNEDCSEIRNFKDKIDLNHYHELLTKRLQRWL